MFVGPATESVLEAADFEPEDISDRRVSHAQLVDVGVNPGVAAKIRREHSLPWSLAGGEDLDRRAVQVRGLKDGEREWVAASASNWEEENPKTKPPDSSEQKSETWERRPWPNQHDEDSAFQAEAEWRERSSPTPVSALSEVDSEAQSSLAEAGITSVRRLASCNTEEVAASLGIDESTVRDWRESAREME